MSAENAWPHTPHDKSLVCSIVIVVWLAGDIIVNHLELPSITGVSAETSTLSIYSKRDLTRDDDIRVRLVGKVS